MWDQRAGWQLCGGAVDRVVVVRVVVMRQVFECGYFKCVVAAATC